MVYYIFFIDDLGQHLFPLKLFYIRNTWYNQNMRYNTVGKYLPAPTWDSIWPDNVQLFIFQGVYWTSVNFEKHKFVECNIN